jgi:hypothetical protein
MQGIDEVNDALVYVCSSAGIQANRPATSSTGTPQRNLTAANSTGNIVTLATPPGEYLNGTDFFFAEPSPDSAWNLSSRPTAAKKIW